KSGPVPFPDRAEPVGLPGALGPPPAGAEEVSWGVDRCAGGPFLGYRRRAGSAAGLGAAVYGGPRCRFRLREGALLGRAGRLRDGDQMGRWRMSGGSGLARWAAAWGGRGSER